MKCLKFGGKCVQECDHYPCNVLKAYNQALEDFIKALKDESSEEWKEFDNWYDFMDVVKMKLSKTNEVRHGYWHLLDECSNDGVYCSECHKKVYRVEYANQKIKSKYCPNCGAIMDLEEK